MERSSIKLLLCTCTLKTRKIWKRETFLEGALNYLIASFVKINLPLLQYILAEFKRYRKQQKRAMSRTYSGLLRLTC